MTNVPLVPRKPLNEYEVNDKTKNKRKPKKPRAQRLALEAKVDQDKYKEKKAAPTKKAYEHKKRKETPKERYTHPKSVGGPVEPDYYS